MAAQTHRRHHYVPKFLLKPWRVTNLQGHENLMGFWWDDNKQNLRTRIRGAESFCVQQDLLTLRSVGLKPDDIEQKYFGKVDRLGALAREALLDPGVDAIGYSQRCDFARLLMSLEARRPSIVEKLRTEMRDFLASELDADDAIRSALANEGCLVRASEFAEQTGPLLQDRALTAVLHLTDNPVIGNSLIHAHWGIRRLGESSPTLVLSDRPLIRFEGYDKPGAVWVLPLSPKTAFIACNQSANLESLMKATDKRFAKHLNASSARQADRYVFGVDQSYANWLEAYLKPPTQKAAAIAQS